MFGSSSNYYTFKVQKSVDERYKMATGDKNKDTVVDVTKIKYKHIGENEKKNSNDTIEDNENNNNIMNESKNIKKENYRWVILSLCCMVITTLYYSFDIATVLHQQLKDYMTSTNFEYKFNLLFVTYSFPNIILPIIGGALIEKSSSSKCLILFSTFCWLGHVIFSIGLYYKNWYIIYIGRFFYGLGGENLFVAQSTIIAQWFGSNSVTGENKDIALAFGISSSISWLGGVFNDWITPILANRISIFFALFVGGVVLFVGVLSALVIWFIDEVMVDDIEVASWRKKRSYDFIDSVVIDKGDFAIDEHFDNEDNTQFCDEDDKCNHIDNQINQNEHQVQHHGFHLKEEPQNNNEVSVFQMDLPQSQESSSYVKLIHTIPKFTSLFWTICICYIFVEGSILTFDNIVSGILMERSFFRILDDNICHLPFDYECTSGTLQPNGKNDYTISYNKKNHKVCNDRDNNPNIAPILPKSIKILTNNTIIESNTWWESNYTYKSINPKKDINCNDPFWSKSCAQNYCMKQNTATERVGRAMSIPYIISSIFVPLLGYISDHCTTIIIWNKNLSCLGLYLLAAPIVLFIVHCTLAFTTISPIPLLIGQGIACALYTSAIWPSIPKSISKDKINNHQKNVGLAYGIITSLLNMALVIFPIITSYIYTNVSNDSYIPNVEYFFVVCAFVGVVAGVVLNFGIKDTYHYLSS